MLLRVVDSRHCGTALLVPVVAWVLHT
jgi:hypothetical protein